MRRIGAGDRIMHVNRREFLRKSLCAALGGVGACSALGNLRLIAAAAAATRGPAFNDYKALVCVYLGGGNDAFNTLAPCDATHYPLYATVRQGLALAQSQLQANLLTPLPLAGGLPGGPPSDGATYGMHPALGQVSGGNAGLRGLFNGGKAAIVANVGTLLYPITQAQYQNGSVPKPPQLYSHDDQTNQWMTSRPDDANADGWGGRIADMLYLENSGALPMSITLAGINRFQRAGIVNQYAIDSWQAAAQAAGVDGDGNPVDYFNVPGMSYRGDGPESWLLPNDPARAAAWDALHAAGTQANVLERAHATTTNRALANAALINAAMNRVRLDTHFPDTDLGNQLAAVALLLKVRATLGMSRQVFFVATGGYDTHSSQLIDQGANLQDLSQALAAFHAATVELGIENGVTTFTTSDFGRSLPVNAGGTDHGWGAHHFVIGGGVRGGRFYGTMPSLAQYDDAHPATSNPDDTGYGQIIPTLAVDQYVATLAAWFGVGSSGIADILPNLGRFPASNLRFLG